MTAVTTLIQVHTCAWQSGDFQNFEEKTPKPNR